MTHNRPRFLDPRSDLVFKKIFGQHPELVKSFLNGILPLPEGHLIESVSYLTPEQAPSIPSLKNTIVDVKCTDQTGRIFIVEMQMAWNKNFMKRFLFGTAQAYIQQLNAGDNYNDLCPVYGLAIIDEQFEYKTPEWFHHYRLTNTKDADTVLEGIELIFLELPKFNPQTFEHHRLGVLWLRFLRETKDMKEIPEEFKDSAELIKAMELSQESAYSRQELEAYNSYLDAVRVQQMLIEGAQEKGKQIGEQKLLEEKKRMARMLIQEGIDITTVSRITGFSEDEIKVITL